MDSKLFAGVRSAQSILASILPETLNRRGYLKSFEALRVHNMTFALKKSQIYNRREQLGLNSEKIAHKYEHLNIYEHPIYEHLRMYEYPQKYEHPKYEHVNIYEHLNIYEHPKYEQPQYEHPKV